MSAAAAPAAAPAAPAHRPAAAKPAPRRALIDPEEWVGQRGLLAVGVVAMILAAGYLLKLSFDRGWISPALRCAGGVVAGGVVAAIGWRLHPRYRTYGAALVGCGAAIVYLAVWAACRMYGLVPPLPGIAVLAGVSLALAAVAWRLDVEALGATAALGAFFAPILLGRETGEAELLLVYLACMTAGLGWVAAMRRWRLAAFVIAASFFGLGGLTAPDADGVLVAAYAAAGGAAGLMLGLRARWWETRFLAFGGGWGMLAVAADAAVHPKLVLAGALLLAAPVWIHALRLPPRWPFDRAVAARGIWSLGELFYFVVTPLLVGWALRLVAPDRFDAAPGLLPLMIAVPYLAAGYQRERPLFAAAGLAALTLAITLQWETATAPALLIALALALAALDERLSRGDGRVYSLALLAIALLYLTGPLRALRPETEPAFVGPWPMTLWLAAVAAALLAWRTWRPVHDPELTRNVRGGLWITAGTIVVLGVTDELRKAFGGAGAFGAPNLAAELSVSAWWLACAAALVVLGFARGMKPIRVAGLVVAGLAVAKVILSDLASLDALYRVASVFILGLVSLSLAYLYHRHARAEPPPSAQAPPPPTSAAPAPDGAVS